MFCQVLDWSMLQGDGPYYIPNVHVRGHLCRTNIGSPASFRGYGAPQGNFVFKTIVRQVARMLGKPPEMVLNLLVTFGSIRKKNAKLVY